MPAELEWEVISEKTHFQKNLSAKISSILMLATTAKTQFLLDAEEAGATILNGLGMSLYQGAAQIEYWTGQEPPIEAMQPEIIRHYF